MKTKIRFEKGRRLSMTRKEMVIEVLKGAFIAKPGGIMRVKDIDET